MSARKRDGKVQGFYYSLQSELGPVWLAAVGAGLVYCSTPGAGEGNMHEWLESKLPQVRWVQGENDNILQAKAQVGAYLSGRGRAFTVPLQMTGTEFQRQVWQALIKIPYGETRTYGQIAFQVGRPKGSRAVGQANNKNPLALVVP